MPSFNSGAELAKYVRTKFRYKAEDLVQYVVIGNPDRVHTVVDINSDHVHTEPDSNNSDQVHTEADSSCGKRPSEQPPLHVQKKVKTGGDGRGGAWFDPSTPQWQAAENLVLAAFRLQMGQPKELQNDAEAMLTSIANYVRESPSSVIAAVRAVTQPFPSDSGRLAVNRSKLTNLCKRSNSPSGFECLTRYVLRIRNESLDFETDISSRIRSCFSTLVIKVTKHPDRGQPAYRGQLAYHALGHGNCLFTLRRDGVAAAVAAPLSRPDVAE